MIGQTGTSRWTAAYIVACIAVAAWLLPASATAAETVTPLPLATFHAIAVDDQTGRIFVSGDAAGGGSAVIVAGFDGAISTQITDLPGASGLALSGGLLYVARCGDHEIEVVDTVSPQMIGSIDTGASIGGDCHIAVASGRIWFVSAAGAISSVEVAAPHAPATYPGLGSFTVPVLAAGGSRLVLADTDTPLGVGAGPQVHVYDVGGPAPQLEIEGYPDNTGYSQGNFADASLSADGSKLLLSGAPLMLVDPATLHPLVVYKRPIRGVLYPMSVGPAALTPSGDYLGGFAGNRSTYSWRATGPFVRETQLGPINGIYSWPFRQSVALSADGRRLFAVGGSGTTPVNPGLWVIDGPALATTTLTLTPANHYIQYAHPLRLTAHLAHHAADSVVNVYATPYGLSRRLVASGHPDQFGNFTYIAHPSRNTFYEAESPAGLTYGSARAPGQHVNVAPVVSETLAGWYATSGTERLYHYSSACAARHRGCPAISVAVAPNYAGTAVSVSFQALVSGRWETVSSGTVRLNARSRAVVLVITRSSTIIGHHFRVRASIAAHKDHMRGLSSYRYFRLTY